MRDHSVYKHGLILTRDNFLITGNNLHLTIGNNKNVIVAVGVIIFGTAPLFFNIGNRSSVNFPHFMKELFHQKSLMPLRLHKFVFYIDSPHLYYTPAELYG